MRQNNNLLLLELKQICDLPIALHNKERYVSPDFGLIRSFHEVFDLQKFVLVAGQPYRLTEGRVVMLRSGEVRCVLNLRETSLSAGELVVVPPGTVVTFIEFSPDADGVMLAFSNGLMEGWQKESLLSRYLQGSLLLHLPLEKEDAVRMEALFSLLWQVVHDEPFPHEMVRTMISLVFHQIEVYHGRESALDKRKHTRQEEVFNRFLDLVNKHAVRERSIAFYANRLYLTPRYLSTLIRQTSGRTVMDWVNEAVIQEAKLQIRHTDKLIYQISDDLDFPNASFFCKYFHRMTGKTPNQYRRED